jgi:hypothetical protein
MTKLSATDTKRMIHINHLMDGIHDSCDSIYECLVDREFTKLTSIIEGLIHTLNDVSESVNDE